MHIRAHHLLCIQGFRGSGYNKEFIDNMSKVIEIIKSYPTLWIEITENCDIICSVCPHRENDLCQKEKKSWKKVQNLDRQVLIRLGLKKGAKILAEDIPYLIEEILRLRNFTLFYWLYISAASG